MAKPISFEQAVFESRIKGPEWPVVNEDGSVLQPQIIDEWDAAHINVSNGSISCIGKVVDFRPVERQLEQE
jgi:hypothetical protein